MIILFVDIYMYLPVHNLQHANKDKKLNATIESHIEYPDLGGEERKEEREEKEKKEKEKKSHNMNNLNSIIYVYMIRDNMFTIIKGLK